LRERREEGKKRRELGRHLCFKVYSRVYARGVGLRATPGTLIPSSFSSSIVYRGFRAFEAAAGFFQQAWHQSSSFLSL
jgi:hypothetical protein